ncbi:hypothetical protein AALP_AA8G143600 [Arabis alpina]|uniref:Uncharacterized protein n=1 Tax=Arabis alpina TaxID=50452 RepID=A0A087G711_ARAAL|nr:hypothetical protein AALP_AA8G143600 [Arabis alpina]
MPSLSMIDTIRDMIRDRNLLIAEEDILIPTMYDHPWTPPDGFLCLYESFFNASALWFPLPKLLIEYCDRRLIAISQLTHAAVRNIVTVLTLAAEIGRSVNCLEFEEIVQFKRKGPHWTWTRPPPNKIDKLLVLKERREQNWPELLKQKRTGVLNVLTQVDSIFHSLLSVPIFFAFQKTENRGLLREYDPTLDFVDKLAYTLYAEELVRVVSHINFMATRLEKTELKIIKLTSEVEALKGKLDRQRNEKDAEILLLKEENEKLKAAGTDVVQRTVQTMIGKALSEMRIRYEGRLNHLHQCSVDAKEVNRLNSLINQVNYSLELYAGLKADGIAVPGRRMKNSWPT